MRDDAIETLRRDTIEESDALVEVYRTRRPSRARPRHRRSQRAVRSVPDLGGGRAQGQRIAGYGPRIGAGTARASRAFRIAHVGDAPTWSERMPAMPCGRSAPTGWSAGARLDDWETEQRGIERALACDDRLSLALGIGGGLVVTRYVGRRLDSVRRRDRGRGRGRPVAARAPMRAGGGDAFDRLATGSTRCSTRPSG